ncbi:MAG: molecular chaperone SurA [Methylococcaceae bacterium]|nr:molecular chaperone SurA [Methylococcaceae bacterium]
MIKTLVISFSLALSFFNTILHAETLDRIVAIVERDVVLDSELNREAQIIAQKIKASNMTMPPATILRKQVLERLIIQKLQSQLAQRSGAQISNEMLHAAVSNIAAENNMSYEQFRETFEKQDLDYKSFENKVKNEIVIEQMRLREIGDKIKVTDREVQHYLETRAGSTDDITYHLGHILVALPEGPSANSIQKARAKAVNVIARLNKGEDFKKVAMAVSDDNNALTGGDLGWRTIEQMPTVFTEVVPSMKKGDVSHVIRSPSGFHIIKVLDLKGSINLDEQHIVTKTKARHILIKTNELINDDDAQQKLVTLKQRIADGDDFATLARSNSDDTGTALKGGDLGWVTSGVLVPAFEQAMNTLTINEISKPVQTPFGWHIIQVQERQQQDDSSEFRKNQIREQIRRRKIEEESEIWLRRLRGEAFIKIYLERL